MKYSDAQLLAVGYAWGREDATTRYSTADPDGTGGAFAFSLAFAEGYQALNDEKRHYMCSVQDAYQAWQASEGKTIFKYEFPVVYTSKPAVRQ